LDVVLMVNILVGALP